MASEFKRLRTLRRQATETQVVEISQEIRNQNSERIPDDVWDVLQGNGREAALLLQNELKPHNFSKLAPKDRRALLTLALDRAYGKADPGLKRSIDVSLSAQGNDVVAASLERLGASLTLPEYTKNAQIDETEEYDPDQPPDI